MGSLKAFNIQELKDRFSLVHFFETGTGFGDSLDFACGFGFERYWSCEIDPALYWKAAERFSGLDRVNVLFQTSTDALTKISGIHGGILFWLDAHYPESYSGKGYDHEQNPEIRNPLRRELETIRTLRDYSKDVIIIDDLRIYQHGEFQSGNIDLPDLGNEGIEEELFIYSKTHDVEYDFRHEGYVLLTPK